MERRVNILTSNYRGKAPHKHCEVFTKFTSNSLGVLTTTFLANPAIYLTNFELLKIDAMPSRHNPNPVFEPLI